MTKEIQQSSLKTNIIISTLYKVLKMLSLFITTPHISRALGVAGVGTYSFINSIVTWFVLFAQLGTLVYGSLEIAKVRDEIKERSKVFYEVELLTVFTSIISLISWFTYIYLFRDGDANYALFSVVIIASMFDISWFFAGIEQFKYTILWSSIITSLGIIAQLLFVKTPDDFFLYVIIMGGTSLLSNICIWACLPLFLIRVPIRQLSIWKHLKGTMLFFIPSIATSVFLVLDKTLIGIITQSSFENGYYEQAVKVTNFAQTLAFTGLNTVLGSRISFLYAKGELSEIKDRINKSIDFILFIGIGAFFGIIGTAKCFVPVFYGVEYGKTIYILMLLSPIVLIMGLSNTLGGQYYNPAGLRAKSAKFIIIGAVINFTLNIVLIPKYAAYGAVLSSIIGETIVTLLYIYNCGDFFNPRTIWVLGWKKLIAGAGMFVVIYFIGLIITNLLLCLILQVLSGMAAYCGLLVLFKDSLISNSTIRGWINRLVFRKHEGRSINNDN